jgi:hypothetical protein
MNWKKENVNEKNAKMKKKLKRGILGVGGKFVCCHCEGVEDDRSNLSAVAISLIREIAEFTLSPSEDSGQAPRRASMTRDSSYAKLPQQNGCGDNKPI